MSSYVSTGIESLNELLGGGFARGDVTLIGSKPGLGKTSFLLASVKANHEAKVPTFFYSDELGPDLLDCFPPVSGDPCFWVRSTDGLDLDDRLAKYKMHLLALDSIGPRIVPDLQAFARMSGAAVVATMSLRSVGHYGHLVATTPIPYAEVARITLDGTWADTPNGGRLRYSFVPPERTIEAAIVKYAPLRTSRYRREVI
jgi:DnaB-like helicase C terminal domain